jgi:signal transduction histidine kinase
LIEHRLQRKVALGFAGAMLLTASLDFLSWRAKQATADGADSMAHTYSVMTQFERTLGDVVDMETGARGFAATGQEQFLDPLTSAQLSLGKDLKSLRQLTAGDPNQMTWLAPLTRDINKSVSAVQEIVALRRQNSILPLSALFQHGKQLVDTVRTEIRAEQAEQTRILNQGTRTVAMKGNRSDAVMLISTLVEMSLLVLAWIAVSRALLASAEAQIQIEGSNVRLEQRTRQLEAANEELEAFTYSVSHDLRAPLRHISGFSKLLVEGFGSRLEPEAKRYLERITQGVRKMGVLVDELLGLAGVGRHTLNVENAALNPLVDEIVAMLVPETEGRLVEWKIANLGSVPCDPALLRQVFQNLIANALKFTRPRATALVEIGRVEDEAESTFFVRDNGVGFDIKYADKLFGVFQRLHRGEDFEGTGIGLATVRRIVQKHGGRTWADAKIGTGATFYFTVNLPAGNEIKATNSAIAGVQS